MKKVDKNKVKDVAEHQIDAIKKIGIIGEFKEFISRGNVLDLAVGVIIGSSFQNLVTSLTNNTPRLARVDSSNSVILTRLPVPFAVTIVI